VNWSLAAAAVMLIATLPSGAADKGELCFKALRTLECVQTAGDEIHFGASSAARDFIWSNAARDTVTIGRLKGGETAVDLKNGGWRAIDVRVTGRDPVDWPQPVTVTFALDGSQVSQTVPARTVHRLRHIRLPGPASRISFSAPHHRPVQYAGDSKAGQRLIEFVPLPAVNAVVVDGRTKLPIAGASINNPLGSTVAFTSADGHFRAEFADAWPAYVAIAAPGFATKVVALTTWPGTTVDAGTVTLGPGGSVRISIDVPGSVELSRRDRRRHLIRVVSAKIANSSAEFTSVDAGEYVAVVRGSQPTQRLAVALTVRDGETTDKAIHVEPISVLLRVRANNRPVPNAIVKLSPASGEWDAAIAVSAEGTATTEVWQQGEYVAFVSATEPQTEAAVHKNLSGEREIEWPIDLPSARIRGVVASRDGSAIRGATLTLNSQSAGEESQNVTTSDENGRFEFANLNSGNATLTSKADGFLQSSLEFSIRDDSATQSVRIEMDHGYQQQINVRNAAGVPAVNALIVSESGFEGPSSITDASGTASITMKPAEHKQVFILPADGSFIAVDVTAPAPATDKPSPITVTVPAGVATIAITAQTEDASPLAGVAFAIRLDGKTIPEPVRHVMLVRRGIPLHTGNDGTAVLTRMPSGMYEIWPYRQPADLAAITNGSAPAPVRLAANPGINTVRMTFSQR